MVNNAEYYSDAARDAPLNPLPSNSCIPPLEPGEDTHQLDLMRASRAYFCMDAYLERLRDRGVTKTAEFNAFQGSSVDRWKLLDGWINLENGAKCYLFPKFTCEYGFNITIKGECYIAPGCTFIDVSPITIGKDTMIGANSQLYTPHHPISPEIRNGFKGPEGSSPIVIGDNVWIGGGVIICPGVTIGDGTTIGAGSVVTKDIPARCVAVGNPARVVKRIEEDGTIVPVAKSA